MSDTLHGLVIDRSADASARLLQTIIRRLGQREAVIVGRDSNSIETVADVLSIVDEVYDFIVLPLSLPNYNSIRVAEYVHSMKLPTRLLLKTASSDYDRTAAAMLYDSIDPYIEHDELIAIVSSPRSQWLSQDEVRDCAERLLRTALCLGRGRPQGRHHGTQPSTLDDYDAAAQMTRGNYIMSENGDLRSTLSGSVYDPAVQPASSSNPWISGSFYLVTAVVIIATLAVAVQFVSPWILPVLLVAGVLLVMIVGALQLRNDERLKDKLFVELMQESLKRLPLLRQFGRSRKS